MDHLDLVRPASPGMAWPAVPPAAGAVALALQFQLRRTERLAPEVLRHHQFRQVRELLRHAYATVPFQHDRLAAAGYRPDGAVTAEWFAGLPLMTRSDIQSRGAALHSTSVPAAHGRVRAGHSSGSTGAPITFLTSAVTAAFWQAFNLRDQLWHRRDLSLCFAAIRPDRGVHGEQGVELDAWGPATTEAFRDGPARVLHSANTVDRQLEWLATRPPAYLLTLGSNLLELAREMARRGVCLPGLREACTYGDTLTPAERAECRTLLGVPVTDVYSAQETGYIALQCPDHDGYHVQAEGVLVEILDEDARPCAPGRVGQVVVTCLHNFAMPLIRYAIGDHAEAGGSCPCGRGLPVIRRVLGRERNMAEAPDGRRFYPSFAAEVWMGIAPIRQIQLVQRTRTRIEARVAAARELTVAETEALVAALRGSLGHPFEIVVVSVGQIPRSPGGKYEDFIRDF